MTSQPTSQKRSALEMTNSSPATTTNNTLPQDTTSRPALSGRQRGTLKTLLTRSSPFANETGSLPIGEFDTSIGGAIQATSNAKILVVGAGGLGCEILKDLAMSCVVKEVVVIDLDSIDVTNLNRQFLFRSKDVGHSKAEVAAKFINERCPWMNVVPYHGKIQDKDADFYRQVREERTFMNHIYDATKNYCAHQLLNNHFLNHFYCYTVQSCH